MTYESSGGLEFIRVYNTTTIAPPTSLAEIDIIRYIESCNSYFFYLVTAGLSGNCDGFRRFYQ